MADETINLPPLQTWGDNSWGSTLPTIFLISIQTVRNTKQPTYSQQLLILTPTTKLTYHLHIIYKHAKCCKQSCNWNCKAKNIQIYRNRALIQSVINNEYWDFLRHFFQEIAAISVVLQQKYICDSYLRPIILLDWLFVFWLVGVSFPLSRSAWPIYFVTMNEW